MKVSPPKEEEAPASRKETVEEVKERCKRVIAQMNDLYDGIFNHIAKTAATDPLRAEGRLLCEKLAMDGRTWDFIKQAMLDKNLYEKLVDEYGIRSKSSNSDDDE